jgi:hypothetical protein
MNKFAFIYFPDPLITMRKIKSPTDPIDPPPDPPKPPKP